jgi:hypothetical protein
LGVCFWFFPGTLVNKIVAPAAGVPEASELNVILVLFVAVLGLFLMAHGTVDLVFHLATIVRLRNLNQDVVAIPPTVFAGAIASTVEIAIGVAFCIGRRRIGILVQKARG